MRREPVVVIRAPAPEEAGRCRTLLAEAGLDAEPAPGGLAVRDASPDEVNALLVAGGVRARAVAREQVGRLVGWLLDHQGDLAVRGAALQRLVSRAIAEAGLAARYTPKGEGELLAAAEALCEHLLASGAAFVPWERFVREFCAARAGPAPAPRDP